VGGGGTKFMKSFHDQGWVHGDLQVANILCDRGKLMLVDFDWAGRDGKVSYPTTF
jgi:thiamine kinase-like enzyme